MLWHRRAAESRKSRARRYRPPHERSVNIRRSSRRRHYIATTPELRRLRVPLAYAVRSGAIPLVVWDCACRVVVRRRAPWPSTRPVTPEVAGSSPVARASRSPCYRGDSSFRRRSQRYCGRCGVALWCSARAVSSVVSGPPGRRIVERCDRRGEPVAQEEPAPSDPPRGQIAAVCELVHGGAGMLLPCWCRREITPPPPTDESGAWPRSIG
jgi:hypothetical protein